MMIMPLMLYGFGTESGWAGLQGMGWELLERFRIAWCSWHLNVVMVCHEKLMANLLS